MSLVLENVSLKHGKVCKHADLTHFRDYQFISNHPYEVMHSDILFNVAGQAEVLLCI